MHEVHVTSESSAYTPFSPWPSFHGALYSLQNAFRGLLSPVVSGLRQEGLIAASKAWCPLQRPWVLFCFVLREVSKLGVQLLSHRVTRNIKDQMESIMNIFFF